MAGGRARGYGLGRPAVRAPRTRSPPPRRRSRSPRIYRALRKGREDGKDEPGAADFYYGEMEMRRQRPRGQEAERAPRRSGERPSCGSIGWSPATACAPAARWPRSRSPWPCSRSCSAGGEPDPTGLGRTLLFSLQSTSSLFRVPETPGFALTAAGELLQVVLRLLGPSSSAWRLLSLRGRVKR